MSALGQSRSLGDVPAMSGLPPVSGRSCVIAVGLRSANNGREQMQQRVVLFNYFVGAGEQRGAEGRERRDQLFSSRLSSLKKRQSVPCELILLGVDLIMPDSCFLGGARPAEVEISASHDPHPHAENSESRGRTRDRLRLPWSKWWCVRPLSWFPIRSRLLFLFYCCLPNDARTNWCSLVN